MRGSITKRGRNSWRIKFDLPGQDGKRDTRYVTVRGLRKDAQRKLVELANAFHTGTFVDHSKVTVAQFAKRWMEEKAGQLQKRTHERYSQLLANQVLPFLGNVRIQNLRPIAIRDWQTNLLKTGGKGGKPLSARSVVHAHRLLHVILQDAAATEVIARNPASVIGAPKVEHEEIEIIQASDIDRVMTALDRMSPPFPCIALVAITTGCRRGELLALGWEHVNLTAGTLKIDRSLGQTQDGALYLKKPKTKAGFRTIRLSSDAIEALRAHKAWQAEMNMRLGFGKPAYVFTTIEGEPMSPNGLSRAWGRFVNTHDVPDVSFHALRHTHVSMLIAGGLDAVSISKRIGHANASITMRIYAHLFNPEDDRAPGIVDAALGKRPSKPSGANPVPISGDDHGLI